MSFYYSRNQVLKTASKFRKRKRKLLSFVPFLDKTWNYNRQFHVVVLQRRQWDVQKSVRHVQSCCFPCLNLLLFCRSRCRRRRRRRCVNSLFPKSLSLTSPKLPFRLTLSLPEWMLESFKVVLTFESVDKILWCRWPFKWNLSACTFKWCYLFPKFCKTKFGNFCWILPLSTLGTERLKRKG